MLAGYQKQDRLGRWVTCPPGFGRVWDCTFLRGAHGRRCGAGHGRGARVALAETLDAPLVTADAERHLGRVFGGEVLEVEGLSRADADARQLLADRPLFRASPCEVQREVVVPEE